MNMKKPRTILLLTMAALLCAGCSSLPAEERSFAVALGVNVSGTQWTVCARIPSYQAEGGYLTLSAEGNSFREAMATLDASSPMRMHYAQLRLIIVSRALAESEAFPTLVQELTNRHDVRQQATLCVTEDDPVAVMDALDPTTGSRLSKSLDAMIEARETQGVISRASLADIALMGERQSPVLPAIALKGSAPPRPGMDVPAASQALGGDADGVRIGGGYLIGQGGRVRGALTPLEQQLLALLTGQMTKGTLTLREGTLTLLDASHRVVLSGGAARCQVLIRCENTPLTEEGAQQALTSALTALTGKLSAAGCDALGLARQVITHSPTLADWHRYDWPARYPAVPWEIEVEVRQEAG